MEGGDVGCYGCSGSGAEEEDGGIGEMNNQRTFGGGSNDAYGFMGKSDGSGSESDDIQQEHTQPEER